MRANLPIGSARALVVVFVAASSVARADPQQDLATARVCWAALDPECAETALVAVRAALAELPPEARLEALRLSAEVALATDRPGDAHDHLLGALAIDPRFSPSGWSRAWLDALEAARRDAPDRLPPELAVIAPAEVGQDSLVTIEVRADDPGGIARCEAHLADGTTIALMSADGRTFRGDVPGERVRAPELLFHVEAVDRAGNVARWPAGVASERIVVTAPPPPVSTPIIERWWFWTAIGAVVAGGVTALVIVLDEDDAGAAAGPARYGTLQVLPEFP